MVGTGEKSFVSCNENNGGGSWCGVVVKVLGKECVLYAKTRNCQDLKAPRIVTKELSYTHLFERAYCDPHGVYSVDLIIKMRNNSMF